MAAAKPLLADFVNTPLDDVRAARARRSLMNFTKYTKPDYEAGWFHEELAHVLDKFLDDVVQKKSPRLIIMAPPRHGKTELTSRRFPAYALGKYPDITFIATSYASDLASSINRDAQRIIDSSSYRKVFPGTTLWGKNIRTVADGSYLRNSDIFEVVNKRGVYKSAGVGAGVTGRGGECFPAGTRIATPSGYVCIEEFGYCTSPGKVLSFNHEKNIVEIKRTQGWYSREVAGLLRITTASGRVVEATTDHPIFSGGRYVRACDLAPGDSLVLLVREGVCQTGVCSGEESSEGTQGSLLLGGVLKGTPCREEQLSVCDVQRPAWGTTPDVLPELRRCGDQEAEDCKLPIEAVGVPDVQHNVHSTLAKREVCPVLFEGVRTARALTPHVGHRQSEVEGRCHASETAAAFGQSVSCDAPDYSEARSQNVRGVQSDEHAAGSASHRQQPDEQCGVEPCDVVLALSSDVACCDGFKTVEDSVAVVERLRDAARVYDIQVEDNHNFFANDILVHNCLIIDDPVKDAAEAHSETVRQSIWDWFASTLYTRAMPGGGILLIMTRWHMADLAGRLIDNMNKGGEKWDVFKFPAIAEEDEYSLIDGRLLRRAGEALHPERYSLEMLERIKSGTSDEPGVGSKVWASLYQQRPSAAEGNIFKRENWEWFKPLVPLGTMTAEQERELFNALGITQVVQSWDTALGTKKQNDWTACTTLGVGRNRYYVLEVWKGRLEFPEVKRQVQLQFDKWRPSRVYVEGGGSASGKATVQSMRRDSLVPIFESIRSTDKILRADTISPAHEAKLIALPQGETWVAEFVDNAANFPNIKFDDDIDSFIGAMEEAIAKRGPMEIPDELLRMFGAGV